MDWAAATAAGAFVVGAVFGAFLVVRLIRVVWGSALRARRDLEDEP